MEDFTKQNEIDRNFFKNINQESLNALFEKIRKGIAEGEKVSLKNIDLTSIIKYNPKETQIYITLFQEQNSFLRYGSRRSSFENTINRCVEMIRKHKRFNDFDVQNKDKCQIMLEYTYDKKPINPSRNNMEYFDDNRFEPGIDGYELKTPDETYFIMPTDSITQNLLLTPKAPLNLLIRRTPIGKMTNKIGERIKIASNYPGYDFFKFKSRAFITYQDKVIALYRGNILYDKFSYDTLYDIVVKSSDWLIENMLDDGRFLYYYNCVEDNRIDHEHPTLKKEEKLYYNDLRHNGGVITLLRAYQLTKNEKYVKASKKALDWSKSISIEHDTKFGRAYCPFYNAKVKLGGVGIPLVAMMQNRIITGDKTYDEYIKGYVRHLLSRVDESGEMIGYYIHPNFQDGNPLINITDKEMRAMFSFYYPGEALLGLALFANHFEGEDELKNQVREISKKALDWLMDVRPEKYKDQFTALPSDAWLMQAIEEWCHNEDFRKQSYIDFVYNDALTMIDKMYTKDNSPYIDYEGGYYYDYGDHYFPDGARSEGLIAAYYLARNLDNKELAQKILDSSKLAAKCQFHLFNEERNSYPFKNKKKSLYSIRFKATRQWVRVDSIQHVSCFFSRLYMAENKLPD